MVADGLDMTLSKTAGLAPAAIPAAQMLAALAIEVVVVDSTAPVGEVDQLFRADRLLRAVIVRMESTVALL